MRSARVCLNQNCQLTRGSIGKWEQKIGICGKNATHLLVSDRDKMDLFMSTKFAHFTGPTVTVLF